MAKKIIILGAGLTGLSIAYLLKKNGITTHIIEARNRVGGRVETIKGNQASPMEMGATWFGKKHQHLMTFLEKLNIGIFQQYMHGTTFFETMSFAPPQKFEVPASEEPSFRIQGGTSSLIFKLATEIGMENISLHQPISKIEKKENTISVFTHDGNIFEADLIISTIPPKLFVQSIECSPLLPKDATSIFGDTQIWMEGSVKFSVEYASPFWREQGLSGAVFSQSSLIPEMYDHTNYEENKFALKGFLNGSIVQYSKEDREKMVIQNLKKFFGSDAENHIGYFDRIWEKEKFTFSPTENFLPSHYNNGHPIYQNSFWDNSLFMAGTETSPNFGGYMEGAIQSALLTSKKIINAHNNTITT
ncbi:MAG: flavin monoamine oxidase family protein [Saprospiraceae bacterium]